MKSYYKTFEVRWSDLDANRHVANSSYVEFMNHTRISFLATHGFPQEAFEQHNIGPIVFSEEFYYLQEVLPLEKIAVDLEVLGLSEDYRFAQFSHSLFKQDGTLATYSTLIFAWMDLEKRKLTLPPAQLISVLEQAPKADSFTILTKENTRKKGIIPQGKTLVF